MPSEPSVAGTKPQSLSSQNAALQGASLAFNRRPAPKPGVKSRLEAYGALAAATKAGSGNERQVALRTGDGVSNTREKLAYHNTGSSVRSYTAGGANGVQRTNQNQFSSPIGGNGSGNGLLYPNYTGGDRARSGSASFIAATLAASRSASVSPNVTGQREGHMSRAELRRRSSFERRGRRSESAVRDGVERESIPPTKGLIGLFERNDERAVIEKRSFARKAGEGGGHRSIGRSSASPMSTRAQSPAPSFVERSKPEIKATKPSLAQTQRLLPRIEPQKLPPPNQKPVLPASNPIPIPPSPRRRQKPDVGSVIDDASSDESFVSASDTTTTYKPSFRAALTEQRRRPTPSTHNSVSSAQTIDSMANAIVASSLAASRSASPSKAALQSQNTISPPPPPPRRHHLFHTTKADSRTPSPVKQGMKTTMRKQKSREEVDEGEKRRGRKNLMKKHPNKHHEGDRKRWRDSITERERKRYEAVWASNRGLFLPSLPPPSSSRRGIGEEDDGAPNTGPAAGVCNLVVKDVWSRCRLDDDVLEEVYELVDRKQVGWLAREEFVVGLWLIDQRLKGRKLPIRVSDSVWRSVGILSGIKVRRVR